MNNAIIDAVADIHVAVSMNLPGPYPMYTCDQFDPNPSPDCSVICKVPTNIIFTLDRATVEAGWHFAGYSPNSSSPMPLHTNLGFSSTYPNLSVTVFNPCIQNGDIHSFSLYYSNEAINNGTPFSFDPETENQGGSGGI
ncbi:MAG: hypothetical protein P4L91_00885 [Burkholderiaceae bacterium]|nr:hypothetical protein [Burkholderiaceae bacterium]